MILVFRLRLVHYKYMDSLLFEQHIYLCIAQLENIYLSNHIMNIIIIITIGFIIRQWKSYDQDVLDKRVWPIVR